MSSNRIALITGANRGIGRSAALSVARDGVDLIITYRSHPEEAEAVAENVRQLGQRAEIVRLDLTDVHSFDVFAERIGERLRETWNRTSFDFLVNNGGIAIYGNFAEFTEEDFDAAVNVHFKGVFFLTQKLLPSLADGGAIVNISSGLTRFTSPGRALYASVKGAVEVLTVHLAEELGARGIRVNTIAPGAIATDFGGAQVRDNPEIAKRIASLTALKRTAVPDDVGPAIASLLRDDNHWITAQRIEVSGGMHL